MPAMPPALVWQISLLMAQPPLSAAYLAALRGGAAANRVPVAVFAMLPAVALVIGWHARRNLDETERRWNGWLLALAVVEIAWSGFVLAIVDFSAAWRLD